ncbi:Uncharacterised protein [Mycobacteroides abscessus subsp. abscessus]|nr:Uncharacterised protein [Mycobacteroides abscessus subsp. abscessus]
MVGGEAHDGDDIIDAPGPDETERPPGRAEERPVGGEAVDDVAVGHERTGAELLGEHAEAGRRLLDAHQRAANSLATARTRSRASSAPMLTRTPPESRRIATAWAAHASSNAAAASSSRAIHT